MKLIEKKCPNCGANLEFNDTDKSCKCSYCHRAFEIERDSTNEGGSDLAQQFYLNEMSKSFRIFSIIPIIVFVIVFIIFGFVFYNIYQSSTSDFNDSFDNDFFESSKNEDGEEKGDGLFSDVSELTNSDYESIDNDSMFAIKRNAEGVSDAYHSYNLDGDAKRQKVYVAYKDGNNSIVAIYQVTFKDFFHQENRFTFYVPIVYENIPKNKFGDKFENPQVKAPEYYFNDDHSSFSYGYGSMDEAYNDIVKPLTDQGYTVTEK